MSAKPILHKYSNLAGVIPAAAELALREIALNTADGRVFVKRTDGTVLTFKDATAFAAAAHLHDITDITGLRDALDALSSSISDAQSAATGASLQKSANLSDVESVSGARTNLDVFSKSEVSGAIATAKGEAQTYADGKVTALVNGAPQALDTLKEIADAIALGSTEHTNIQTSINGVSDRVTALEAQNLDARLTAAQADVDASAKKSANLSDLTSAATARTNLGLGSMAVQASSNVDISGGSMTGSVEFGAASASVPSNAGKVITNLSTLDGGTFGGGGNGGGGGGGNGGGNEQPPTESGGGLTWTSGGDGSTSLSYEATGATSWQWQVSTDNGASYSAIPGATSAMYTFTQSDTVYPNGGRFRCVASNAYGSVTSSTYYALEAFSGGASNPTGSVTLTSDIAEGNAPLPAGVVLTVTASDLANFGNGYTLDIVNSDGSSISGVTDQATFAYTATASDGATVSYTARLINNADQSVVATSPTLTFTFGNTPTFSVEPQDAAYDSNNSIGFQIGFTPNGSPSAQWQKFENGTWVNVSNATGLTIGGSFNEYPSGVQFRVVLTNPFGSTVSGTATVTWGAAPQIGSHTLNGAIGDTLSVSYTGDSPITVSWFRDSGFIGNGDSVTATESGTYSAFVSNAFGSAQANNIYVGN